MHSPHRLSQPRELQRPSSRASVPRGSSIPPPTSFERDADVMLDSQEQGLDSIAEHGEALNYPLEPPRLQHSHGAFDVAWLPWVCCQPCAIYSLTCSLTSSASSLPPRTLLARVFAEPLMPFLACPPVGYSTQTLHFWLIVGAVLRSILLGLRTTSLVDYIPPLPSQTAGYQAPEAPTVNILDQIWCAVQSGLCSPCLLWHFSKRAWQLHANSLSGLQVLYKAQGLMGVC